MEHILARRSIRAYRDEPVAPALLVQLLQAATAAPSAANRQPWEFVVVTEPERLASLRAGLYAGRYHAPAAIVVCGNLELAFHNAARDYWIQDCSAATENILLAATGLGLGAVWIGVYPAVAVVRAVSACLALPEHVIPLSVVYVGHPAEEKPPRTQFDPRRVYWQQYDAGRKHRARPKDLKHT
jgi:nitroreductase